MQANMTQKTWRAAEHASKGPTPAMMWYPAIPLGI
jgi:hypothetical protein